jgi:nicotinate-nucleotide adenylyltransferase
MKQSAVGILGGSFNPVHLGHVRLAEELQARCAFDPLWVVPAKSPPHKPPYEAPDKDRLEMVQLAFGQVPGARVSTFELDSPGPSYAIRTIEHFTRQHPGAPLYFVLGDDAFNDLPRWYAFPDVMEACNYIVVTRAGWDTGDGEESLLQARLEKLVKAGLLSASDPVAPFARCLRMRSGNSLCVLESKLPEISSTEIRVRLQLGESVSNLVPDSVARYLKTSGLYGSRKL